MKVVLVVLALCAVAFAQTTIIDDFTVPQTGIRVSSNNPTQTVTVANGAIYGGERETEAILDTVSAPNCADPLGSTTSVNVNGQIAGFTDSGVLIVANDQTCFGGVVVTYDGVGGAGLTGSSRNLNAAGSAFRFRYFSDLTGGRIILRVVSGANACTSELLTTGNNAPDTKTILFTSFSAGCDFNAIDRFEIDIPSQINFDVTISIFEIISTALSGRVYVDCACDNTFNLNDQPLGSISVTATPVNCPAGTTTRTTTTNSDGTYRFTGLAACSYSVAPTVTTNTPCGSATRTGVTTFGTETTGIDFPYRGISSFSVPRNIEITCLQKTDTSVTGVATTSDSCNGGRTITSTDVVTAGNCDSRGTIVRTFTDGVNTGTQTITIIDTGVGPSLACPANTVVACDSSLLPSVTGRPSVNDDCSRDIDVTYTGTDVDGQCDGVSCTRNRIVSRVFRAVDDCGNAAASTCTQTITITPCDTAKTCPTPPNCHNGSIFYRDRVAQN